MKKINSIDQHIAQFPKETQQLLELLRMTIRQAAPTAEEVISYSMPAFKQNGVLVWFTGYKNHIGFYPSSSPIEIFKEQLTKYKTSKGAIQFSLDKPLTLPLITKIVKFRIKQDSEKAVAKKNVKKCSKGHTFTKTSACPTCPICEQKRKPKEGFLSYFAAPARRALENKGIKTVKQLSKFTQAEMMALHGIGPSSLPIFQKALKSEGLTFKKKA